MWHIKMHLKTIVVIKCNIKAKRADISCELVKPDAEML